MTDYESAIKVETVYDNSDQLEKIIFLKNNKSIPRTVFKVIALAIPYHKHLTSITINSGLRMGTCHEISKFLPDSNITELCLDGSFLAEGNYHTLLTDNKLKHLSLAKCSINDDVVKMITDLLVLPHPASKVLSVLNLSSNRITDVGAKYVAGMLRSNRQLSYLNLAGNMITDEGGVSILDMLQKFPLDSQEFLQSRIRYVAYLKKKKEFTEAIIKELLCPEDYKPTKGKKYEKKMQMPQPSTPSNIQIVQTKAESIVETKIGLFNDPFSPNNTESQDGATYCLGNNTLCWLNLAFNKLTYHSVKKLLEVLVMQKFLNRTPIGLIRVVIEGNLMPVICKEYDEISCLLASRLVSIRKQTVSEISKKKLKSNYLLR